MLSTARASEVYHPPSNHLTVRVGAEGCSLGPAANSVLVLLLGSPSRSNWVISNHTLLQTLLADWRGPQSNQHCHGNAYSGHVNRTQAASYSSTAQTHKAAAPFLPHSGWVMPDAHFLASPSFLASSRSRQHDQVGVCC